MAMITNSEFGMIAVNNSVVCKLIIDDMLSMSDKLIPCNKKGRALKKSFFTGYNELFNAIELQETVNGIIVVVYFISVLDKRFQETSDELFDLIENEFELLSLDPPAEIRAKIKGVAGEKPGAQKEMELIRRNV